MPPIVGVPALALWPGPPRSCSDRLMHGPHASQPMRILVPMSAATAAAPAAMRSAITSAHRGDGRAPPARRHGRRMAPPMCRSSASSRGPCRRSRRRLRDPRSPSAERDGAPPVGLDHEPAMRVRRFTISAMIAAGSSLRGLSEVTTATSRACGGRLAHARSLGAIPVPAGAEDEHHAMPAATSRAASSTLLEAIGRVGVVDDDAERLALVDRLEPPWHRSSVADARHDRGGSAPRARPTQSRRRGRWGRCSAPRAAR